MNRRIKLVLVGLTIGIVLNLPAVADDTVNFDLANEYAPTSIPAAADKDFVATVAKKSADSIKITPHFSGSLGFKSKDQFDAVRSGIVPIASSYAGTFIGINPFFAVNLLPFLAPTLADTKRLYEIVKPEYERIFKANNQKLLYATPYTPIGIWSKQPVKTISDLKGLKIRTFDEASTKTFRAAGASAVQVSWADVVSLLSTGGLSGVVTAADVGVSASFWDYMDYFTKLPYGTGFNLVAINLDAYNRLAPDQQQVLMDAAATVQKRNWDRSAARVERNRGILKEHDITIIQPKESLLERLETASQNVIQSWTEETGARGQAVLDKYNK